MPVEVGGFGLAANAKREREREDESNRKKRKGSKGHKLHGFNING